MANLRREVSIQVEHEPWEEDDYGGAFTIVSAKIFVNETQEAGSIEAVAINRSRIPRGYFLQAMDEYSRELQGVASAMFDPKLGRYILQSMAQVDNNPRSAILYIEKLHLEDAFKGDGDSEVGARAIQLLLSHPTLRGNVVDVHSAVYILDGLEAMVSPEDRARYEAWNRNPRPSTAEEREEYSQWLDTFCRKDANQFLRNGFFQDEALAAQGNEDMLVAHRNHYDGTFLTHEAADAIQFAVSQIIGSPPTGKDAEIFAIFQSYYRQSFNQSDSDGLSKREKLIIDVAEKILEGGSIARSNALHLVASNGSVPLTKLIIQLGIQLEKAGIADIVNARDQNSYTPLMCAAIQVAGTSSINGCDSRMVDCLIEAGASLDVTDAEGMTAYGHYDSRRKELNEMIEAMTGQRIGSVQLHPTERAVQDALRPPGGPTEPDLCGGRGEHNGFVTYDDDDDDDSMGDGSY
jgi:hypothetical protein